MDLERLADELYGLGGVEAVALGGSRARGVERPDSDWDLAVYYRGTFDPDELRALGYPGSVTELGGWGGGVFNGGGWLEVDGERVDVHYRDLASIEHELAEARAGRMRTEPLLFHLAGIPNYIVLAEVAVNRVLRGELPRIEYPVALAEAAPPRWWDAADLLFHYARAGFGVRSRPAQCVAMTVQAATFAAHAILAARRDWVTNEKGILEAAGLGEIDALVVDVSSADPAELTAFVDRVEALCAARRESAPASTPAPASRSAPGSASAPRSS